MGASQIRRVSPHLVMKFGGTSVGSPEAILEAAKIVENNRADWSGQVVVLSALAGVTNALLESASKAVSGRVEEAFTIVEDLRRRHHETVSVLIDDESETKTLQADVDVLIDELRSLCGAIGILGEATPRALDSVASLGERLSIRIFAGVLRGKGIRAEAVDATELIVTDDNFQSAHPDLNATRTKSCERLLPLLEAGIVPVVTGFIAATRGGITTTLGRGGSDYSAALLAAVINASQVWIWTDVDGVMTADPRMVPEARTIPRLSYLELAELAYFGAKVLHPMTIRPVVEAGIGLSIRNTFNPSHPGTELVSRSEQAANHHTIKAVTAIKGQRLITIEGRGMLGVPGVAGRAFGAVAATGTNVILISQASSEQSITFAIPSNASDKVTDALEQTFASELANRDIDRVWVSDETVIVTVVGAGMRHIPGVAGQVFSALGAKNVNVIAIAQGSSEVSISLVVDASEMEIAVKALHSLIGSWDEERK